MSDNPKLGEGRCEDHAFIGAFDADAGLFIRRAPNGGWIVQENAPAFADRTTLGAFSTTGDLLIALQNSLGQ
ncbi:hypothetical protein [Roseovarius sp. MMSF_3350]|uniref:hypothetical protein n=1 Tax=Roseovarius sp. MMSF_3350 TaxID=3046706 RepID=UPI00273FB0EB|nr:hypothetical protein [Roseovarius sp. MMSF_3350]